MRHPVKTIRHVAHAVAAHGFTDAEDWARAIDELAELTDQEIEAITASRAAPPKDEE